MKIVKLKGGLGNQLFQYAFAKELEKVTGDIVKIDLTAYQELNGDMIRKPRILQYNISLPIATERELEQVCLFEHTGNSQSNRYRIKIAMESMLNKKYMFEHKHKGCTKQQMIQSDFFDGYWQDWEIVDRIMPILDKELLPINKISKTSEKTLDKIKNSESVFVGIRRGDYLTTKPKHYGIFNQEYYDDAMERIVSIVKNPVFYIFSNDMEWVRKNMNFSKYNICYINDTIDDFEDFLLMTECKHAIIANSTFHWWGARRHEYPGKVVVAPKKWFADEAYINILPNRWEKI